MERVGLVANMSALLVLLTACAVPDYEEAGSGPDPLQISPAARQYYEAYLRSGGPLFFAITQDGRFSYYDYCLTSSGCAKTAPETVYQCTERAKRPCYLYAAGMTRVWKDGAASVAPNSVPAPNIIATAPPNPNPASTNRSSPPVQLRSAPLALSWDGVAQLASGTMRFADSNSGKGPIEVSISNSSTCKGEWQYVAGAYNTQDLPRGTWTLRCSDGVSANGFYRSISPGKGNGSGQDSRGRAIKLTYGN